MHRGILVYMKVFMLYRPNTDHERRVLDYTAEVKRQTGHDIELVSLDTVEGANKAKLYDVMEYPALLVTMNDGHIQQSWSGGEKLPLINEITYYLAQA